MVKAAAHGISQGTLAMMQNDGAGFLSGAAGGFFGSLGATAWGGAGGEWKGIAGKYANSSVGTIAFGALSGGVGAELSGGNFWQGAITGGIVAGLNHVMHSMYSPDDNGYDENGNQINKNGGDETDYLYDKKGNIIGSKKVFSFTDESSELTSDYRAYGIKIHTEGTGFDWTWDSVKDATIYVGTVGVTSSKLFNTKIVVPIFKGLGRFIKNYAPSLNKGAGFRIGISQA